jgi:peptidyl-prolyl cis-trans isomerase C
MYRLVCLILTFLGVVGWGPLGAALGQEPPAAAKSAQVPKAPAQDPAKTAAMNEPVATINGEAVTKGELVELLARFEIPPGSEQRAYDAAIDVLVNTKLLQQFMRKRREPVPVAEVDKAMQAMSKQFEQQGSSLTTYMAQSGTSPEQLRRRIETIVQWEALITREATNATLKKYMEDNLDVFSGAEVRASHILIKMDPKAPEAEKAQARQKLMQIKQEIESGQITFADAANKYSEDDGNKKQPSGGDLGYFPRRGVYIEPFAKAAFAMKPGTMSDPVETEYGWHLILAKERREGRTPNFERDRQQIHEFYSSDRQAEIVEAEKKDAKIEIHPMPQDLFRQLPADATAKPAAKSRSASATTKPATKSGAAK